MAKTVCGIALPALLFTALLGGCNSKMDDAAEKSGRWGAIAADNGQRSGELKGKEVSLQVTEERFMKLCEKDGFKLTQETALDTRTGLMWPRDTNLAGGAIRYEEAALFVGNLHLAGFHDWRLPTREEARALLAYAGSTLTATGSEQVFRNVDGSKYWTSTPKEGGRHYTMRVRVKDGAGATGEGPPDLAKVLPVRDASQPATSGAAGAPL